MCGDPVTRKAHVRLAELIERELEIVIDPAALRLFIRGNWPAVASFAHSIHGSCDTAAVNQSQAQTYGRGSKY